MPGSARPAQSTREQEWWSSDLVRLASRLPPEYFIPRAMHAHHTNKQTRNQGRPPGIRQALKLSLWPTASALALPKTAVDDGRLVGDRALGDHDFCEVTSPTNRPRGGDSKARLVDPDRAQTAPASWWRRVAGGDAARRAGLRLSVGRRLRQLP